MHAAGRPAAKCHAVVLCHSSLQALRLALLALDGGITLEPFSDYVVFSLEVGGSQAMLRCAAICCAACLPPKWLACCVALCGAALRCAACLPASQARLLPPTPKPNMCALSSHPPTRTGSVLEQPRLAMDHSSQRRVVYPVWMVSAQAAGRHLLGLLLSALLWLLPLLRAAAAPFPPSSHCAGSWR